MGSHSDLVGVTIIETPIRTLNEIFANLFSDTDEWTLDRAIAVTPEIHFGGIKMWINPIGPAGEQRGFAHHYPLGKVAGFLEGDSRRSVILTQPSPPQERGELTARVVKAHDRGGGVNLARLFDPGHVTRLKREWNVRRDVIPENIVEKEPLRANRVLCINAPSPVGDNQGIDRSNDPAPGPRPHPQLPVVILARCRDIHPVLARLLEYHAVTRRLEVPKAICSARITRS